MVMDTMSGAFLALGRVHVEETGRNDQTKAKAKDPADGLEVKYKRRHDPDDEDLCTNNIRKGDLERKGGDIPGKMQ